MVIPSGIHTDLGTLQLRKMLFEKTRIDGLFGFENRKGIFEGVHRMFKFNILTFQKGGKTEEFPTAFMRHEVSELADFPRSDSLRIPVELIKRISPDSWSVMEFKGELDVQIAEKMLRYPLLGEEVDGKVYLKLTREFDMTNDSHLFKTAPGVGRLPLYEGKMIWQFDAYYKEPRYWVDEKEGRKALLGRTRDAGQKMDYQDYRLGIRSIASNVNERTLIANAIPKKVFCGNSLLCSPIDNEIRIMPYLNGILNSYVVDWLLRIKVSTNINMFYLYQLPIPRFDPKILEHNLITRTSATLMCVTPEFDALANSIGLAGYQDGVTDPEERAKLRAELDAMVAHLYGLTEEEFAHVLSTFPLVDAQVKQAAMEEFRKLTPDAEIADLLKRDESETLEFKHGAFLNPFSKKPDESMKRKMTEAVAAFMNSQGGTLLIGVSDDKNVEGIEQEFSTANPSKKNWDGYHLALVDIIQIRLNISNPFHYYTISKNKAYGKIVCRIEVSCSPGPVFIEKKLFIREGNRTRELQGPDLLDYVKNHWKK